MFDDTQSVASWFDKQLGTIIAFAVVVAGIIAGYVRLGMRVDVQGADIVKLEGDLKELREKSLTREEFKAYLDGLQRDLMEIKTDVREIRNRTGRSH
jgi:hypothetical protein